MKKQFVGTCVGSFDEDGYCIVDELPWRDVTQFAVSEEEAKNITRKQFINNVVIDATVKNATKGHVKFYLKSSDGVYMLYDDTDDIHYFFM